MYKGKLALCKISEGCQIGLFYELALRISHSLGVLETRTNLTEGYTFYVPAPLYAAPVYSTVYKRNRPACYSWIESCCIHLMGHGGMSMCVAPPFGATLIMNTRWADSLTILPVERPMLHELDMRYGAPSRLCRWSWTASGSPTGLKGDTAISSIFILYISVFSKFPAAFGAAN